MTKTELKRLVARHLNEPIDTYETMFQRANPMGRINVTTTSKILFSLLQYIDESSENKKLK